MKNHSTILKDVSIRFFLGGTAVVLCYLVSIYSPVKFLGGVFAAFPAVMAAAITMAGIRDGSSEAGEVAKGAVSGMIGCTACVLAALYLIKALSSWPLGLAGAVGVWLVVSVMSNMIMSGRSGKASREDEA